MAGDGAKSAEAPRAVVDRLLRETLGEVDEAIVGALGHRLRERM